MEIPGVCLAPSMCGPAPSPGVLGHVCMCVKKLNFSLV